MSQNWESWYSSCWVVQSAARRNKVGLYTSTFLLLSFRNKCLIITAEKIFVSMKTQKRNSVISSHLEMLTRTATLFRQQLYLAAGHSLYTQLLAKHNMTWHTIMVARWPCFPPPSLNRHFLDFFFINFCKCLKKKNGLTSCQHKHSLGD